MPLTIKAIRYQNRPLIEDLSAIFDHDEKTLGRAADNHLVLPDLDRHVSSHHASIRLVQGIYHLKDTSANGTIISNTDLHLQNEQMTPLHDGDQLKIGDYDLIVSIIETQTTASLFSPPDIDATPVPWKRPEQTPRSSVSASSSAIPFDGEDMTMEELRSSTLVDIMQYIQGLPADTYRSSGTAFGQIFTSDDNQAEPPQDIIAQFGNLVPHRAPLVPEPDLQLEQPLPDAPQEETSAPTLDAIEPGHERAYEALFQQFLAAAGIHNDLFYCTEDIPALMQMSGLLFRELLEGLMTLLRGRTRQKMELRIPGTILDHTQNNPLKFSVDVDELIQRLLTGNHPGFVHGAEAVRDAHADIMSHHWAMIASIKATVETQFELFDPKHIETQLKDGILFKHNGKLVFNKKARSWDAYREAYPEILKEAQKKFSGDVFIETYRQEIQRLRSAGESP
jgi:type VI secretion system FHA domain protein